MAFLNMEIGKDRRLVNTDQIVEVQLHVGGLYFRMNNGEDFSLPLAHSDAPVRVFEELKGILDAKEFPSAFLMANLGPQTLG